MMFLVDHFNYLAIFNSILKSDGPGVFDFVQGVNSSMPQNPFWQIVKRIFI